MKTDDQAIGLSLPERKYNADKSNNVCYRGSGRRELMKNRKIVILASLALVMFLAACGVGSDQSMASGEMVAPEVSSQDLLVSSLEYLLLNDAKDDAGDREQQDIQGQDAEEQNSPDATDDSENTLDEQTPQDENAVSEDDAEDDTEDEEVVIFYGNGGSVSLNQETVKVEAVTPDELINALARHNIVSLDTKVLTFEKREQDDVSILYLDLSKAAGEYLKTMSMEAESIIVASIINTFLENYDADTVFLTVEGKSLVTSNADYSRQLEKCTPEELMSVLATFDAESFDKESGSDAEGGEQRQLPLIEEKK